MNAYERQIGGNHYVTMGMQPFHFAMANGWDATAFSILKYVSRHRSKNGAIDIQKAIHIVDIRNADLLYACESRGIIRAGEYIRINGIQDADALALLNLESWVEKRVSEVPLLTALDVLLREYPLR